MRKQWNQMASQVKEPSKAITCTHDSVSPDSDEEFDIDTVSHTKELRLL